MLYSFFKEDGRCDFIQITDELDEFLTEKDLSQELAESYLEGSVLGIMMFLTDDLGFAKSTVMENVNVLPDVPKELASKILKIDEDSSTIH